MLNIKPVLCTYLKILPWCKLKYAVQAPMVHASSAVLIVVLGSKGRCKKIATHKHQRLFCPSILSQSKYERLSRFSRKTTQILNTFSLCYAEIIGSKAMFLKSIFSCNHMVCEFYSNDPCSYFFKISVGAVQVCKVWKALLILHKKWVDWMYW